MTSVKRGNSIYAAAAVCLGMMCASCGIFSPRPVEYPSPTVVDDPFNFASILWNMGDKKFTKLEYDDLFADDFSFIDINNNVFTKDILKDHLNSVHLRFTVNSVSWKKDPANSDVSISDTLLLVYRSYDVSVEDDSTHTVFRFADNASFKLIFSSLKNAWIIQEWKDKYPGYSVFHPWFSTN